MSERLIGLADRQGEILRLLAKGLVVLTELHEADATHLVILQNRGLVALQRDSRGQVVVSLTAHGLDLTCQPVRP